jgi:GNAT superfamily N-acetyltransferase
MPLPVIQPTQDRSGSRVLAIYIQTEHHWAGHFGEPIRLDEGTAWASPEVPRVGEANQFVQHAPHPNRATIQPLLAKVQSPFERLGCVCRRWTFDPCLGDVEAEAAQLRAMGWKDADVQVMLLAEGFTEPPIGLPRGVTVLPMRSAYSQVRELSADAASRRNDPALVDAVLLHLDDPIVDGFLLMDGTKPLAGAMVMNVGENARIESLYVHSQHRRRGLGRAMLSVVLHHCRRSASRRVMVGTGPGDQPAATLYMKCGCETVGIVRQLDLPENA